MAANPLDTLVKKVNKDLGEGTLIKGSDLADAPPRVPSGSLAIDLMLGGGWPLNCWSELVGEPSSGKSVIAAKTIAAAQALNPDFQCLWVAAEPFEAKWAAACGVDLSRTTLVNTRIMEEAYQVCIDAIDGRLVDAVVIDSLSALTPKEEDDKAIDELTVGLGARLTNKFMRKSGTVQRRSLVDNTDRPCLGLIISQFRDKVGVSWGDTRTTPYGRGKEFHYMIRVEVRRDDWIEHDKHKVGMVMKARTVKNKTAPPQRLSTVDFYWEQAPGFDAGDYDLIKEIANIAMALDVVERAGAYYRFNGRQWQGKDAFLGDLRSEVDLRKEVEAVVRNPTITAMPVVPTRRRMKHG